MFLNHQPVSFTRKGKGDGERPTSKNIDKNKEKTASLKKDKLDQNPLGNSQGNRDRSKSKVKLYFF